ncbi:medium-chain acyl-CoA ligase ACSF2, mitochondrial-like isoform X1 [Oratosquilla oratoria]|uniref:medium-chain acyl-CoA ligase ACSF2, mitochondrial-like isoform X1 n=3 Tax=Oratosquilla oratoria TaxID=337810 RepID=UPI003F771716
MMIVTRSTRGARCLFTSQRNVNWIHQTAPGAVANVRRRSTAQYEWSYVSCVGQMPLSGLTFGQMVDRAEDLYGDREAIVSVHQGVRATFSQMKEEADKLAAGFLALGLNPGDRIGIWGPNMYEWVLTQYAAAKAGLVLVNINPAYRPNELLYCLNKVSVRALVCAKSFKTSDYYKLLCEIAPEIPEGTPGNLKVKKMPNFQHVIMISEEKHDGCFKFNEVLQAGDSRHTKTLQELSNRIQFDDACNIQFTSGTTGSPKAAALSHHNIVNNALFIGLRCGYGTENHRICLPAPLYHCLGCVCGTLTGLVWGATCVMPSAGFDPEACVTTFEKERITSCYGTPTMFVDILKCARDDPKDFSSLFTGIMAGAPCPQELVMAVMEKLNMKDISVMYGMTENSPVTFQCFPSDPLSIRSSTIGFPGDHIEVKVVDSDGRVVRTNEPGELLIRGYCNFLGYWGDEEKTKEVFTADRWFKTGDLAAIRTDGYGQIIGRIKDVIIRGGENIYPAEVENFFMGHPDIIEAQVFSIPSSRLGEEVAAWLRTNENSTLTADDVKQWCKDKIAHYKIPRYILFKDEFPRTVTGKIQKFIMRDETMKELQLSK